MASQIGEQVRYRILDPTGNITALVESRVNVASQPQVADRIMQLHPEVEQVGFVSYGPTDPATNVCGELRMAGGEFCGNATMCAGALYLELAGASLASECPAGEEDVSTVLLKVSGAKDPVEVRLQPESDGSYLAGVLMPPVVAIEAAELSFADRCCELPVVRMEGISHIVVELGSTFFSLKDNRDVAELVIRDWCTTLGADGLGLMFLEEGSSGWRLTPLVYVPGCDTVFWESSCASGSASVGVYRAALTNAACSLSLREPGGTLRVESDPATGKTWLHGRVRNLGDYALPSAPMTL